MEANMTLMPDQWLYQAAECLKVMAHPVRLRIVEVLMQGAFPVHRIAELCQVRPQQACEHLRLMQGHGLLGSERRGRTVYYRIASPRLPGLIHCIQQTCDTPAAGVPAAGFTTSNTPAGDLPAPAEQTEGAGEGSLSRAGVTTNE